MTISLSTFTWMVAGATLVTLLTPLVLMVLWFCDWMKGRLW